MSDLNNNVVFRARRISNKWIIVSQIQHIRWIKGKFTKQVFNGTPRTENWVNKNKILS